MDMPKIINCDVVTCSYNVNKKCQALAITVGDPQPSCENKNPACDTYMASPKKGGAKGASAGVGACKVDCCQYNNSLECTAPGINVGLHANSAECVTFKML